MAVLQTGYWRGVSEEARSYSKLYSPHAAGARCSLMTTKDGSTPHSARMTKYRLTCKTNHHRRALAVAAHAAHKTTNRWRGQSRGAPRCQLVRSSTALTAGRPRPLASPPHTACGQQPTVARAARWCHATWASLLVASSLALARERTLETCCASCRETIAEELRECFCCFDQKAAGPLRLTRLVWVNSRKQDSEDGVNFLLVPGSRTTQCHRQSSRSTLRRSSWVRGSA